jgi:hypothetical protein
MTRVEIIEKSCIATHPFVLLILQTPAHVHYYLSSVQSKISYNEIMTLPIHEKELSGCGVTPFPQYPAFKSTALTACQFCSAQNRNGYVLSSMNTEHTRNVYMRAPNSLTRKAFFEDNAVQTIGYFHLFLFSWAVTRKVP